MPVHVALLRGINVGGNKKVSMPLLKQMFETMGFKRVQTYINSGNVLFEAEGETAGLGNRIEQEIEKTFGFPVAVVLRTAQEMNRIAAGHPFEGEGDPKDLHLHVGFLAEAPAEDQLGKLLPYVNADDEFRVSGREIFFAFRAGVRDSKLANNVQKLRIPCTLRNWNTTVKLAAMASASD